MCWNIGEYVLICFKDGDNILIICNVGSIVIVRYGIVLVFFYIGKEKGVCLYVYVCEMRLVL